VSDFDKFLEKHGFHPGPKVLGVPSLKAVAHRISVLEEDLKEHLPAEKETADGENDS
jgi:hypothetical protein